MLIRTWRPVRDQVPDPRTNRQVTSPHLKIVFHALRAHPRFVAGASIPS